jgi:hypothetical protein
VRVSSWLKLPAILTLIAAFVLGIYGFFVQLFTWFPAVYFAVILILYFIGVKLERKKT